ncbi:MAG TPA: DUF2269 family protein [Candidatus Limnocylindria bacterium]
MTLFTLTKFIHVTLAIVAVGFNLSYAIWIVRSTRDAEHLGFVMRTIRWIDARIANPAYGVLLVTGLFMAYLAPYPLTTFWIAAALVLYATVALLGILVIAPNFRAQLRALETDGATSDAFRTAAARGRAFGLAVSFAVVVIVFLMVTRPTL